MSARTVRDPSPVRTAIVHSALGAMTLMGTLGLGGAIVHFTGDADAASPAVRVALFEANGSMPALKTRLPGEIENAPLNMAALETPRREASPQVEGDLGVEYGQPRRQPASPKPTVTVASEDDGAVRINGKLVRPGQSYGQLQDAAVREVMASAIAPNTASPDSTPTIEQADTKPDTPETVFERHSRAFENADGKPTVSVVLGGLGINYRITQAAINELPPEITLSFSPSARGLSTWVRRARAAGHEVLIEVPMEPYEYGRERPHPNVLQIAVGPETNEARLRRTLAQARGYMGVMNYKGDKFATNSAAAAAVLEVLNERGLAFVQDGSFDKSVFTDEAKKVGMPFGAAGAWIDARPEADEIQNKFLVLEMQARENGYALGTGMPFPITIDMLKEWTEQLDDKGLVLAPASYYVKQSTAASKVQTVGLDQQG